MPKSYELKLREAEERRRPPPKEEVYKAIERQPQRMMLGFDHPETLQLEMQLTWVDDTYTIDQTHEVLMSKVLELDAEYRRKPLQCKNYYKKFIFFDRFWLRPRINGTELLLQDYGIEPGYRVKLNPMYQFERVWGCPNPVEPRLEKTADQMEPMEDKGLLVRLDKGPPTAKNRLFLFPWMGGRSANYASVAEKLPKDYACFALELPGRGDRESDEGYPSGEFQVEVIAKTLAKEMKKPGNNYFFGHSEGAHFAYYVSKVLSQQYFISPRLLVVSNSMVPAAMPSANIATLRDRHNACIPLRIFVGMIKEGWGVDAKLGYKSHMGYNAYQSQEMWPLARATIMDWWSTKEFPLPGADAPLDIPVAAIHGQDDPVISADMVAEWRGLTRQPREFEVVKMDGGHLWFHGSSERSEALAMELSRLIRKFQ
uniref:Thioesterase domain-containing protein n=1 Tax=Alexandrium monilatum TaxID=311494 RepID=A0A7S4US98_9DINO|mmetsp:Transcript_86750/g.258878  ORF Transcript_86750/g.258878 Transcript_86750/m.258878 type:complete len:427 (-) Transcript_86750:51-1331(-)